MSSGKERLLRETAGSLDNLSFDLSICFRDGIITKAGLDLFHKVRLATWKLDEGEGFKHGVSEALTRLSESIADTATREDDARIVAISDEAKRNSVICQIARLIADIRKEATRIAEVFANWRD